MGTSTEPNVGGFTDGDIEDVTKSVIAKLADGAGRPIVWDKLTDVQKAAFLEAAKLSITGERTTGFANFFLDGFREVEKRSVAEREEYTAQEAAAQHLEAEFPKLTLNEFVKRRG